MLFLQYNVLFKKNYIYIYIYIFFFFFNFFIYGVSSEVSIFWGPISYRPGFGNLEMFPRFVQLSFEGNESWSLIL
jgi:hypothetical protein